MPAVMKRNTKKEAATRLNSEKPVMKFKKEIEREISLAEKDALIDTSTSDNEDITDNNKSLKKKDPRPFRSTRGVVYIKHLPHGFFEYQLKEYFSQFGTVTRARLCRSQRTLNSKGFGFVEFKIPEVAQIAAETMNNYMMFNRTIKTSYIPPEAQQYDMFTTRISRIKKAKNTSLFRINRNRAYSIYNRPMQTPEIEKKIFKLHKKLDKLGQKYKELGIDFNLDAVLPKIKVSLDETYDPNDTMPSDGSDQENEKENVAMETDMEMEDKKQKNKAAAGSKKISATEIKKPIKEKDNLTKQKKISTPTLIDDKTEKKNVLNQKLNKRVEKDVAVKNQKNKKNLIVSQSVNDESGSDEDEQPKKLAKQKGTLKKEKTDKIKKVSGGIQKKSSNLKKNLNDQKIKFAAQNIDKQNLKTSKNIQNLKKQKQKK